ncbi:MAG TPA: ATP-binding cassette domain-containing protein [Vicinamibacteria bacterium]|nr:ATP-binding cassette domain-containing protein [Vicinamibacteria bacterium]
MIEYRDVHKAFDMPVLSGVSLTVNTGEILGVLGPSGTGKSVLLKTTIGLIVPDRGDVLVDGVSVYDAGPGRLMEVRRKAGYVFQYAALFDSMNVYENVSLGIPEETLKRMPRREVLARVSSALEDVNLDPYIVLSKMPSELSGGMKKRVGLARAIVGEPAILLYDEPVTGLDPVNTAAIDKLITDITARRHVTSIVVTHDVEGALAICDRVALLEGGKLRFVGTPEEFRTSDVAIVRAFADRRAAAEAAMEIEEETERRRQAGLHA